MQLLSKDNVKNIEQYKESFLLSHRERPKLDLTREDTSVQTRDYLKDHKFIRKFLKIFTFLRRYFVYLLFRRDVFIDESAILFSASNGKGYNGNPKAIYELMIRDERFKSYKFIWLFDEPERYLFLLNNPNTFIAENTNKNFYEATNQSRYWMFDFRIPAHIFPRPRQVYFQLSLGNPIKKSGYSATFSSNPVNSVTEYKFRYYFEAKKMDILIAASDFAGRRFKSEYNLEKLSKEEIIKVLGSPKMDFLFEAKKYEVDKYKILKMMGIKEENKKIILFAPAFRDDQYDALTGFTFRNILDFDYLREKFQNEFIFIYRPHFEMTADFDYEKYKGFVYDGTAIDDINYLYLVSDILITDYSTAMFEYAYLGKPMIHFLYDYKTYSKTVRPIYLNEEELPGVVAKTLDDVCSALQAISLLPSNESVEKSYDEFNKKYNYLCDGFASKRVADIIINEIWD